MSSVYVDRLTRKKRVLVVDDEKNIRLTLKLVLEGADYEVAVAESAEQALTELATPAAPVDAMILDLGLPGMGGLDLLHKLAQDGDLAFLPVLVISGHGSIGEAVSAIKLGARDFLEKPLQRERVLVSLTNMLETERGRRELLRVAEEGRGKRALVGSAPAMQKLFHEIERVAPTKANVLLTGESGTGKELVARAIHELSPRLNDPFIRVNCAAIPRELIESELFGHERGAFTGAHARKRGLFEQAHGGTLLLDEVADMELAAQAKVLRALQSGEITRVGSEVPLRVDVRVLAATNKPLEREVARGAFREDLYFRLHVFPILVPPLRERREDIPPLVEFFLAQIAKEYGLGKKRVSPTVMARLAGYNWPGNVRELRNVVERMAILSDSDMLNESDLPENPSATLWGTDNTAEIESDDEPESDLRPTTHESGDAVTLADYRASAERAFLLTTLRQHEWNISRAAVTLGIERTNLHKKIRNHRIRRGE